MSRINIWKKYLIMKRKNPTKNPTLFVDIDGVIVLKESHFDEECIKVLNRIIRKTNCDLIISSDYRTHFTLKNLGDILALPEEYLIKDNI